MSTVAYLNAVWNVDEFSAMGYTLNVVSKSRFFPYIQTFAGSETVLENFSRGSWKVREETSWIFCQ